MKKRSTLERQMLTYFGLIAAASLLITVEFVWAIQTARSEAEILAQTTVPADPVVQGMVTALVELRNKAILMFVVQAVVTLIVLVMLIRRITSPLQQMVEQARLICEGDLSRSVEICRQDEIGLLGDTINGLTSNIQEIVAFGLSTESSLRRHLEELKICTASNSVCKEQLDGIEAGLAGFKDILESFKLFPAPSDDKEVPDKR
ncbi:MAG TPA: HAMP domain-containing protein [Desulfomonilaceae bacterium]|nr:HAMP domain-containing protein [Desulfomonilaceae bacterium]